MPVNFDTFVRVANLKGAGELTVRDSGRSLRNEATLGSRVLSFCRGFAEAFGFVKFGPNQAKRQEAAHGAFRDALTARYGEELANFAFKAIDTSQALTGERALEAIQLTTRVGQRELAGIKKLQMAENGAKDDHIQAFVSNESVKYGVMPTDDGNAYYFFQDPGKDPSDKLGGLTFGDESNRPSYATKIENDFEKLTQLENVDSKLFRGNAFQGFNKMTELYRNKIEDAIHVESKGGQDVISKDRMIDLARETLRSMSKLTNDVDAEKVLNARLQLTDLTRDFIDLVMNNESKSTNPARADKLGRNLIEINNQIKDMLTTMGLEGNASDKNKALLSASSYAVRGNPASENLAERFRTDPDLNALKAGGGAMEGSGLELTQLEAALQAALSIREPGDQARL